MAVEAADDVFHTWQQARAYLWSRVDRGEVLVRVHEMATGEVMLGEVQGFMLDYARVTLPDGRAFDYSWGSAACSVRDGTCLTA